MTKATRIRETASALKLFVDWLKTKGRDGVVAFQPQVKVKQMQALEEPDCLLRRDGL